MEIYRGIRRKITDKLIDVKVGIGARVVVDMMSQAFEDVGLVESRRELKNITGGEITQRLDKLGGQMSDMQPEELQQFINSKIDPIEDEERQRVARKFLEMSYEKYSDEKIE